MPDKAHNPGPLGELLAHIAAARRANEAAAVSAPGNARTDGQQALPSAVLDEFQQLWGRIRTESQLRQSLAATPDDAGPLHSSTLLHRAMTLMQDVAPGYLQQFIAYVDALSWMEQLQQQGVLEPASPARGAGAKTPGKSRVRKRAAPP